MKPLLVAIFVAIMAFQSTSAFKADRPAFFQECAVLTNFELDATKQNAVAAGKTRLSSAMKSGVGLILDAWETRADPDQRRLAYILATARRESMGSFVPLREVPSCEDDDECRERKIGMELAKRAKNPNRPVPPNYAAPDKNGHRYYGRGFIQLTFRENYRRAGDALSLDLVNKPDMVLDPRIAAQILVRGMLEGWFGSRKPLSHYIDGPKADWENARNNVNPRSPNKPITAAMAKEIDACLTPRHAGSR